MHALHACGMYAACMPACMIHACSASMHSLEGYACIWCTSILGKECPQLKKSKVTNNDLKRLIVALLPNFRHAMAKFPFKGNFDLEAISILQRFHKLKSLRRETAFEKTWLKTVLANTKYEKETTHALLDRRSVDDTYLTSYQNYRIISRQFSTLCGERYLSDEIVNLLMQN